MLSLREMQLLAEVEYSVEDTRRDLRRVTELFKSQPYHEEAMRVIAQETRKYTAEIINESEMFFVDEDFPLDGIPEELQAESLGFVRGKRMLYAGRLVYPVKDVKGQIMGFCGWDKFDRPKYLDSKNHGYKAKETTFYGMEKLSDYYRSSEPVYVTEGIVCCLYLRSKGLQAIALLGSGTTKYVSIILKRLEKRLVFIPDNDIIGKPLEEISDARPAGEHFVRQVKRQFPLAVVVQSRLAKDVDDTRLLENGKYEQLFLDELKRVGKCPYSLFQTIVVR